MQLVEAARIRGEGFCHFAFTFCGLWRGRAERVRRGAAAERQCDATGEAKAEDKAFTRNALFVNGLEWAVKG